MSNIIDITLHKQLQTMERFQHELTEQIRIAVAYSEHETALIKKSENLDKWIARIKGEINAQTSTNQNDLQCG